MPGAGRPFQKGQPKLAGRKKGTPNRRTIEVRSLLEAAAHAIGGVDRLVAWIKEDPINERLFWSQMWVRLLPVQIQGTGERGEIELSLQIKREDLAKQLEERGLPSRIFGVAKPPLEQGNGKEPTDEAPGGENGETRH